MALIDRAALTLFSLNVQDEKGSISLMFDRIISAPGKLYSGRSRFRTPSIAEVTSAPVVTPPAPCASIQR